MKKLRLAVVIAARIGGTVATSNLIQPAVAEGNPCNGCWRMP